MQDTPIVNAGISFVQHGAEDKIHNTILSLLVKSARERWDIHDPSHHYHHSQRKSVQDATIDADAFSSEILQSNLSFLFSRVHVHAIVTYRNHGLPQGRGKEEQLHAS
jgi:hypothetical protein